jgi:hypothetical protein
MIIFKEATPRHKELVQTLIPQIQMCAKAMPSPKAVYDMAVRFADVLEAWDYSPRELKNLDKRVFFDLLRSWQAEASAKDTALIRAVI